MLPGEHNACSSSRDCLTIVICTGVHLYVPAISVTVIQSALHCRKRTGLAIVEMHKQTVNSCSQGRNSILSASHAGCNRVRIQLESHTSHLSYACPYSIPYALHTLIDCSPLRHAYEGEHSEHRTHNLDMHAQRALGTLALASELQLRQ